LGGWGVLLHGDFIAVFIIEDALVGIGERGEEVDVQLVVGTVLIESNH
jgi:hypothetical protein